MATWAMRQRYAWIDARLAAGESFNRNDIVRAFTVTSQTASATISQYCALDPDALRYDSGRKAFVRADLCAPRRGMTRRELGLLDALKKLTLMARTSGGTAGPDAGLQSACDAAESVISRAEAASKASPQGTQGESPKSREEPNPPPESPSPNTERAA